MSVAPTSPSSRRRPWFHSVIYRPFTVSTALGFYQRHRQGKREIGAFQTRIGTDSALERRRFELWVPSPERWRKNPRHPVEPAGCGGPGTSAGPCDLDRWSTLRRAQGRSGRRLGQGVPPTCARERLRHLSIWLIEIWLYNIPLRSTPRHQGRPRRRAFASLIGLSPLEYLLLQKEPGDD